MNALLVLAATIGFKSGAVTCALGMPGATLGLYCATPAIEQGAYHLGIAVLPARGPAHVVHSGNDILLWIGVDLDETKRPLLGTRTWHVRGYACVRRKALRCTRGPHGFVLTEAGLRAH